MNSQEKTDLRIFQSIFIVLITIIIIAIFALSCVPIHKTQLKRPFIVIKTYPVYQEEKMTEYLFKDATNKVQKTYYDSHLFNPYDTIYEKNIISYPTNIKYH